MGKDGTRRYAVIDIGTVTARLAVSEVVDRRVRLVRKISTICNLGQGVDRTRMLDPEACERVRSCAPAPRVTPSTPRTCSRCCAPRAWSPRSFPARWRGV